MIKNCIMCPLGCELTYKVTKTGELTVSGNNCIRGEQFLKSELSCPKRSVSTLVKFKNGVIACKTSTQIPKNKIEDVLKETAQIHLDKKPKFHTVLVKNISNSGADLIVISK